jgi:hypothetical protein
MAERKVEVAVTDVPNPRVVDAIARPASSERWERVRVP